MTEAVTALQFDAREAIAGAAHVVTLEIVNQRLAPSPIEPRAIIAQWTGDRVTVWTSTQVPFAARDGIDVMLRDRGLRRTSPETTAESLLRGAHASAVLEGSTSTLAQVGAPDALYDQAWDRYQHHYLQVNGQHSAVFDGVVEGLQGLKARGLRLACLTNKPTAFARPLLQDKGLSAFFEHAFGGDAFARKKPDPLPLRKTCEALRVSLTAIVPVEERHELATILEEMGADRALDRDAQVDACSDALAITLEKVSSLDEDRILRRFVNLVEAAVRTSFFQLDAAGRPRTTIAFKFECARNSLALAIQMSSRLMSQVLLTVASTFALHRLTR